MKQSLLALSLLATLGLTSSAFAQGSEPAQPVKAQVQPQEQKPEQKPEQKLVGKKLKKDKKKHKKGDKKPTSPT